MKKILVTGAFGYSGKHIAERLLKQGFKVVTLTGSAKRANPFGDRVEVVAFDFRQPGNMAPAFVDVDVFINTYWVRFNHGWFNHQQAVTNTRTLFALAKKAGVERIVHTSITNPDLRSPFEYFRGKAELEASLHDSGVAHSVLRPAVLFGEGDILVNNIAWMLRHLPVFGLFGDGSYQLQPIHVADFVDLAVKEAAEKGNRTLEAIGPETFSYRELVETIGRIIGKERPTFAMPPALGWMAGKVLGACLRDVTITWEEVGGLMANLLHVDAPPAGTTKLTEWAKDHADTLGRKYANELKRRSNLEKAYAEI